MNYKESKQISEKINSAKKIVINLHRGPDGDSVGSAFALSLQLQKLGKQVDVILTDTSDISSHLHHISETSKIKKVNFEDFDFSDYDLFISPDSSDFYMVTDHREISLPKIDIIVIDHHETNKKFGKINLVDPSASSCAEIVYLMFRDLGFEIEKDVAQMLLVGILTDTDNFRFTNEYQTLENAAALMKCGADKRWIQDNLFGSMKIEEIALFGEYLINMAIDKEAGFCYTGVDYETYKKHGKPAKISSKFATVYGVAVEGANFGIVILEKEPKVIDISLRAREGFDVSEMATELGGGGHKVAAGGQLRGLGYSDAIEKILKVAKKYAKKV